MLSLKALHTEHVPTLLDGFVIPPTNVATVDMGAVVVAGLNPFELLNGNIETYDGNNGYSSNNIGESIDIQLGQPYHIRSIRLLLWDLDDRKYRFYIETSLDRKNWQMAVDKRSEDSSSWQTLQFELRLCVYIRIVGTHNSANSVSLLILCVIYISLNL